MQCIKVFSVCTSTENNSQANKLIIFRFKYLAVKFVYRLKVCLNKGLTSLNITQKSNN